MYTVEIPEVKNGVCVCVFVYIYTGVLISP
jgi:hypothetical protein